MGVRAATGRTESFENARAAGESLGRGIREKLALGRTSVGILFAHVHIDHAALLDGIAQVLDIPIVGCTTYSEATEAGYTEESASLMVLTGDDLEVGIGVGENQREDPARAARQAIESARAGVA